MKNLIQKLDLNEYIDSFSKILSREKSFILEGDINIHYNIIKELSNYNFNPPKTVQNLDSQLMHLQKQGVLKIYEIFEFIKIIDYFLYLKRFNFEGKLLLWMEKIVIPNEIINISGGIKIKESSADLAVIAAIISSIRDRPISQESVFIGEVSLTGEIKDVYSIDLRLKEAQAQGIKKAIIAQKTNLKLDLKTFAVDEVSKVIELF